MDDADAVTHSQNQVKPGETCGRGGDRKLQVGGIKDTTRRTSESTYMNPWGLTETEPKRVQGLELGPVHTGSRRTAWPSCGSLTTGAEAVWDV